MNLPTWLGVTSSSIFFFGPTTLFMNMHRHFFFSFFFGVRPLLFMDMHPSSLFFVFLVSVHFCSWTCIRPPFFFFCLSTFVHRRASVLFFFLSVHFLGCHFLVADLSALGRQLSVTSSSCWSSTLGHGLVEVTKCYLITLLVVHLGSWIC